MFQQKDMKKNCNPVIGNSTEFRIPFSVWRKRSCEEKLKSFESPTWAPIQEYFDHSLENGSADDRPCYQHAYNLIGKCLKRKLTQQREAKRPQLKRKHISLEEDEKQRQSQSQPLVQNILVLGMMGIQPDQYDLAKVTRQSTYPPPLRATSIVFKLCNDNFLTPIRLSTWPPLKASKSNPPTSSRISLGEEP